MQRTYQSSSNVLSHSRSFLFDPTRPPLGFSMFVPTNTRLQPRSLVQRGSETETALRLHLPCQWKARRRCRRCCCSRLWLWVPMTWLRRSYSALWYAAQRSFYCSQLICSHSGGTARRFAPRCTPQGCATTRAGASPQARVHRGAQSIEEPRVPCIHDRCPVPVVSGCVWRKGCLRLHAIECFSLIFYGCRGFWPPLLQSRCRLATTALRMQLAHQVCPNPVALGPVESESSRIHGRSLTYPKVLI